MPRTPIRFFAVPLGAAAVLAALSIAGPLNPTAGPVAPTYKTLTEVEPRTPIGPTTTPGDSFNLYIISQPGSYYLTADARPPSGRGGIQVAADNVVIDLNGFSIDGSLDTTGFRSGLTPTAGRSNIVVRNGTIRNFRGYGAIGTFLSSSFEDLTFFNNLSGQLEIAASSNCTVRNVRAKTTSGETGIQVGANCVIDHCSVEGGTVGITIISGVVRGCSVRNPGFTGISAVSAQIIDCFVEGANNSSSATNGGISVNSGSHVRSCTLRSCGSSGVFLNGAADVSDCQFFICTKGVAGANNARGRVEGCLFVQNTTAISLTGTNTILTGNRFRGNTDAILAAPGNLIGEVLDFSAGGTLTAANSHPAANIIY